MRTIKFRGKSLLNKKWIYGCLIKHNSIVSKTSIVTESIADYRDCFVIDNTVGQFTGLYDKNGREIYEGDIIGCDNPKIKHLIFYNEKEGRFMAALNGDIENYFIGVCGLDSNRWMSSKEVIGNIHDNPELLED